MLRCWVAQTFRSPGSTPDPVDMGLVTLWGVGLEVKPPFPWAEPASSRVLCSLYTPLPTLSRTWVSWVIPLQQPFL